MKQEEASKNMFLPDIAADEILIFLMLLSPANTDLFRALGDGAHAIRDIKEYRKIGTVEECRAAMRKLQKGT